MVNESERLLNSILNTTDGVSNKSIVNIGATKFIACSLNGKQRSILKTPEQTDHSLLHLSSCSISSV